MFLLQVFIMVLLVGLSFVSLWIHNHQNWKDECSLWSYREETEQQGEETGCLQSFPCSYCRRSCCDERCAWWSWDATYLLPPPALLLFHLLILTTLNWTCQSNSSRLMCTFGAPWAVERQTSLNAVSFSPHYSRTLLSRSQILFDYVFSATTYCVATLTVINKSQGCLNVP